MSSLPPDRRAQMLPLVSVDHDWVTGDYYYTQGRCIEPCEAHCYRRPARAVYPDADEPYADATQGLRQLSLWRWLARIAIRRAFVHDSHRMIADYATEGQTIYHIDAHTDAPRHIRDDPVDCGNWVTWLRCRRGCRVWPTAPQRPSRHCRAPPAAADVFLCLSSNYTPASQDAIFGNLVAWLHYWTDGDIIIAPALYEAGILHGGVS